MIDLQVDFAVAVQSARSDIKSLSKYAFALQFLRWRYKQEQDESPEMLCYKCVCIFISITLHWLCFHCCVGAAPWWESISKRHAAHRENMVVPWGSHRLLGLYCEWQTVHLMERAINWMPRWRSPLHQVFVPLVVLMDFSKQECVLASSTVNVYPECCASKGSKGGKIVVTKLQQKLCVCGSNDKKHYKSSWRNNSSLIIRQTTGFHELTEVNTKLCERARCHWCYWISQIMINNLCHIRWDKPTTSLLKLKSESA